MLFSVDWLKQYVEVPSDPEALGQRLTMAGLAVEGIERQEIPDSVLVGKILEAKQHPNADRLTLCTVDVGAEEPLQIVCGAPNARTGLIGAVATVGT
ncbi:MAG: phenylalanine--tRNA ligase subunit beta, partial [Candidatus Eisenbacteria bacterium]|nr:phenylalanine--tRNA ligase subunit beta [Candidatus Eisenbacteria bacterium]